VDSYGINSAIISCQAREIEAAYRVNDEDQKLKLIKTLNAYRPIENLDALNVDPVEKGLEYLLQLTKHVLTKVRGRRKGELNIILDNTKLTKKPTIKGKMSKITNSVFGSNVIDGIRMLQELKTDEKYFKMVVSHCHSVSTGPKPWSRKFLGSIYAQGKFFFFGGSSVQLLNDIRSYNLQNHEWSIELEASSNELIRKKPKLSELNMFSGESIGSTINEEVV